MRIARGRLRRGFFTSSPAVDTASRPMYEKKMIPAADMTPLNPNGCEVGEVIAVPSGDADHDEEQQNCEFDRDHDGVGLGRFTGAADEQNTAQAHQDHCGQIDDAALLRRL